MELFDRRMFGAVALGLVMACLVAGLRTGDSPRAPIVVGVPGAFDRLAGPDGSGGGGTPPPDEEPETEIA